MAKRYVCSECGEQTLMWSPVCEGCGKGGTLEQTDTKTTANKLVEQPYTIHTIQDYQSSETRLSTGLTEFDRVIDGGIVPGQVCALFAAPGTGKSTLLAKTCQNINGHVLYASAEESAQQVLARHHRVGANSQKIDVISCSKWEQVQSAAQAKNYSLIVIDSLQTFTTDTAEAKPGSKTQVEAVADQACTYAKNTNTPLIIIAQVTKDGSMAGPNLVAHIVDTILTLETQSDILLFLRATKNRYGQIGQIGIFAHQSNNFIEVANPEQYLITQRTYQVSGSAIAILQDGHRIYCQEINAICRKTLLPSPRRAVSGINQNRVSMIIAILERYGILLGDKDLYVSAVGGMKITDSNSDIAVAQAIISAYQESTPNNTTVYSGELLLTGEVQCRNYQNKKEYAKRVGMEIIAPKTVCIIGDMVQF